jgi:hypothetical protein
MRNVIVAAIVVCSTVALAQPPAERVGQATHNGSVMNVITQPGVGADGSGILIRIEYLQPRPGLAAIGVVPGTVLVTGQWIGRELIATAVVFRPGCPAIPYAVRGTVDSTETLTLFGPAPSLLGYWCEVLAVDWTANSTLRFEPVRANAQAAPDALRDAPRVTK